LCSAELATQAHVQHSKACPLWAYGTPLKPPILTPSANQGIPTMLQGTLLVFATVSMCKPRHALQLALQGHPHSPRLLSSKHLRTPHAHAGLQQQQHASGSTQRYTAVSTCLACARVHVKPTYSDVLSALNDIRTHGFAACRACACVAQSFFDTEPLSVLVGG
jgi:hypothetical protein